MQRVVERHPFRAILTTGHLPDKISSANAVVFLHEQTIDLDSAAVAGANRMYEGFEKVDRDPWSVNGLGDFWGQYQYVEAFASLETSINPQGEAGYGIELGSPMIMPPRLAGAGVGNPQFIYSYYDTTLAKFRYAVSDGINATVLTDMTLQPPFGGHHHAIEYLPGLQINFFLDYQLAGVFNDPPTMANLLAGAASRGMGIVVTTGSNANPHMEAFFTFCRSITVF